MTFLGNMMPRKNMTMPGGNMTFGASLQNAKMHLTEAINDLKNGNTKGAAMEMNLTAQNIKMHEQELRVMMMQVKNMMTDMKAGSR
jgi:flagellar basal body rod protein FlgB